MHQFLLWEWTWPAVVVRRNLNYLVALGSCVFFTVTHWNQSFSPKCHITSRQGGIFDWVVLFLSQLASTESATYLNWHLSLPVESQIKTSGWWRPSLSWPGKKLWHPRTKNVNFCGLSTCLREFIYWSSGQSCEPGILPGLVTNVKPVH